jgi:Uma2 family endonuclease
MHNLHTNLDRELPTDTWLAVPWQDYVQAIEQMGATAKSYYFKGHMRIEMAPVSFDHGKDHVIIIFAVNLFTALHGIAATGLDTTTFRKANLQDCQPDVAYYLGKNAQAIPPGTGVVDLNRYPVPDLVIEVAKSSLLDDLGTKRALYETLGVSEYWVIDVQTAEILAYAIVNQGSHRIRTSQALPGLEISLLEEALRRSRHTPQSQVGAWLLQQFQPSP